MKRSWFLLVAGVCVAVTSATGLVLFWFVAVPALRSEAPEFYPAQSIEGLWRQRERLLKLGTWAHDDGWRVGQFGGKEWAKPLIDYLASSRELGCSSGHREVGICYIANREPMEDENLGRNWLRWWEEHKNESQEQWIRDGFVELGVNVSLPPTAMDWGPLLTVLGAEPGPMPPNVRPRKLYSESARYNAYRWLRDSGFDPVKYLVDRIEQPLDPTIRLGLEAYQKFSQSFLTMPAGRMAFAPPFEGWGSIGRQPRALQAGPQAGISSALAGLALVGVWMIRRGLRRIPGRAA